MILYNTPGPALRHGRDPSGPPCGAGLYARQQAGARLRGRRAAGGRELHQAPARGPRHGPGRRDEHHRQDLARPGVLPGQVAERQGRNI